MFRAICAGGVVGAFVIFLGFAETQGPAPRKQSSKGPDFGFDYRKFISEHQALVNAGEAEKAVEYFSKAVKFKFFSDNVAEDLKRKFSLLYGSAGKYQSHEIYGYKRVGSKMNALFVMTHYEKTTAQFQYGFVQRNGEWCCLFFSLSDNFDEMAKGVPMQLLDN